MLAGRRRRYCRTYHSHALAHHEHECLLIDGAWVCKEEVGERKVEEGYGGNDGLC